MSKEIKDEGKVLLAQWLAPKRVGKLVRLGQDFDGGYLINSLDLASSKALVSMGIQEDWSFERDFSLAANVSVKSFDFSVGLISWLKCILRPALRRGKISETLRNFTKPWRFYRFFSGSNVFLRKKIGVGAGCVDLNTALGELEDVFLKIDIEGAEYDIFKQIIEFESRLTGIAMEVHGLPIQLEEFKSFCSALTEMKIIHVHPNTVSGLTPSGEAKVLEVTFSKHFDDAQIEHPLPHPLDMPNSVSTQNYQLVFE
ncbi:hypothetical protein N9X77_06535 [Luminiphilus sp.]|nr:hypothetical protein [Luminiphilus sp.]